LFYLRFELVLPEAELWSGHRENTAMVRSVLLVSEAVILPHCN